MNGRATRSVTGTSTPVHTATTRPLVLLHPSTQTRISLHVPSTSQEWIAAEVARDTFQDWIHAAEKSGNLVGFEAAELDDEQAGEGDNEKELVLTAYFLKHVADLLPFPSTATSPATAAVLLAAFNHFAFTYLGGTDVHTLTASLAAPVRALVISSFFLAKTKLEVEGLGKVLPKQSESDLLQKASSSQAEIYALFGGQGMNEVYFDELQVRELASRSLAVLSHFLLLADSVRAVHPSPHSFPRPSFRAPRLARRRRAAHPSVRPLARRSRLAARPLDSPRSSLPRDLRGLTPPHRPHPALPVRRLRQGIVARARRTRRQVQGRDGTLAGRRLGSRHCARVPAGGEGR